MTALASEPVPSFSRHAHAEWFHFIRAEKVIFLLLGALGIGPLFQVSSLSQEVWVVP